MKIEHMKRAVQIQKRLEQIEEVMNRLNEASSTADLMAYLGHWPGEKVPESQVPAPVRHFKLSCLDLLASEKAALEAEFAAL